MRELADARFELIAGERRWRASKLAGLKTIPAVLSEAPEQRCALMALVENIQRADLNPMEEAQAYQRLQREFHLTQEELANRVGKKRSTIANILRLFSLPLDLQQALRDQKMTLGHAKALLSCPTPDLQRALFRRIQTEQLSVREVEALTQPAKKGSSFTTSFQPSPSEDVEMRAILHALEGHLGAQVRWDGAHLSITTDGQEDLIRILEQMGLPMDLIS